MKKRCKEEKAFLPVPAMFPNVLPAWSPLPGLKYGEAFVPPQKYTRTWDPGEALAKGTIFPELYAPYFA